MGTKEYAVFGIKIYRGVAPSDVRFLNSFDDIEEAKKYMSEQLGKTYAAQLVVVEFDKYVPESHQPKQGKIVFIAEEIM